MPVSRILSSNKLESSSFICDTARAAPVTLNPSASREPLSSADIRELSIRKVYPLVMLPSPTVVSYTTFSPLPAIAFAKAGSYFLRHYLFPGKPGSHPLGGAVPYIVRTFLSFLQRTMKQHVAVGENRRLI